MAGRGQAETVSKVLGASEAEVVRQLDRLAEHYAMLPAPQGGFAFSALGAPASPVATVHLRAGAVRRIALLEIPTTHVELVSNASDSVRFARFVRDFERVTQRGGG